MLQAIRDEHEIIPLIERWRELNQLVKTYLDVLPRSSTRAARIHTTFLQAAATTGPPRLDGPEHAERPDPHGARARDPRLLRGRGAATSLLSADYSQVELRVLAHIADEPVLKEIFVRGEDVHTATASKVFDDARPRTSTPASARRRR